MRKKYLGLLVTVLASLSGCNKSNSTVTTGPIDGNYAVQDWTCGSTDVYSFLTSGSGTVTSIALAVADTTASTSVTYSNSCTRNQPIAASYTGANSITEISSNPSCSSACATYCSGFTSSTDSYSFVLSGQTLTLSRTLSSTNLANNQALQAAGCQAGQTETQTWTSQSTSYGSCTVTSGSDPKCTDFLGSNYVPSQGLATTICQTAGGVFSTAPCSTSQLVGSCVFDAGAADQIIERFYSTNSNTPTTAAAQTDCAKNTFNSQSGVFEPFPP